MFSGLLRPHHSRPPRTEPDRWTPRRAARYLLPDAGCVCELGAVVDLSATGVRLRRETPSMLDTGSTVPLWLGFGDERLVLQASLRWERATESDGGAMVHELGLEFLEVPEHITARIDMFLRTGHLPAARSGSSATASVQIELDDAYAVLGVPRSAGSGPIRRAYEALVGELELRSRTGRIDDSTRELARERIELCYRVLSDPTLRRRYDAITGRSRTAA